MPGVRHTVRCAALTGLVLLAAASSEAAPAVRQVLVLQSFDRGNMVLDHFTAISVSNWTSAQEDP